MMSHKQLLPLLVLLGILPTVGLAQSPTSPLNFGNNFFVTGDYIVAGAYGMNTNFQTNKNVSYAVGTITVPDDSNPGIQGTKQVPPGGQVVAALLYWQTVEKVAAPGSGKNGYFGPLSGGPAAPGYAISGTDLTTTSPVAWSSGGCSGSSQGGKVVRTYRADVAGALPVDANGNAFANTSFQVWLPSVGAQAPLTLGATLVVIYRIPSGANGPDVPLNSIVIYDGVYGQTNAQTVMSQPLKGFYDADNAVSRLTHIVGSGQSNKLETVYLENVPLPSFYPSGQPAFPGWYGSWDNPTWTFPSASANLPNPIQAKSSSATTQVVPASSNSGCVSWGAVILSTTVENRDGDGILDSWKLPNANPPGYCDAAYNNGVCRRGDSTDPTWVPLPDAQIGHKDIFLQYDYMCSTVNGPPLPGNTKDINSCKTGGSDYSFDPRLAVDPADGKTAVEKVVDAFTNHLSPGEPFVLHAIPGNAISETLTYDINGKIVPATCSDTDLTCPFPNEPGTIGFREGLSYIKNQTIDPQTGLIGCDPAVHQPCVAVFPHGKKDSYHYALFSHGVGLPSWFLSDPTTLTSVVQSGTTVTFTTPAPPGILQVPGDKTCPNGRVTVIFAISNPSLNGTYCVQKVSATAPYTFTIKVGASANATYTSKTDPNLAVANGQVTSMSGFSDVGGQNSVISLGYGGWGPPNNPASDGNRWQTKAGTFMHELGHTLGLTHGGTFYNNLSSNDYTPTFETNCKPNVQTSMSYLFQVDLLEKANPLNLPGQPPVMVVDYAGDPLQTLREDSPQSTPGFLSNTPYAKTGWYQRTSFAGGTPVGAHCNGTPIAPNEQPYSYVSDFVNNFFWSNNTGQDINFNGSSTDVMHGHNEWDGTPAEGEVGPSPGVDLQQISAVGTITTIGLGGEAGALRPAGGGGALRPAGGGGALHPAGGGGALRPAGGGGALRPAGGGGLNSDITHDTANSYARPPRNLSITQEEESPRLIDLSWLVPTFGQVVQYNIYRSAAGGAFTLVTPGPGTQTTFQDTVNCNTGGYRYKVTTVINNDAGQALESVASNIVPGTTEPLLTGCYTVPTFSSPASAANNSLVPITWTLEDDFYIVAPSTGWADAKSGHPVVRQAANTLVAIGPLPKSCKTVGPITLLLNGVVQNSADTFTPSGNQFTFTWNTKGFCSGSYTFKLDLDSGKQTQTTTTPLVLK